MTSYKNANILLNDLDEFADTHKYSEAENLIAKARMALEKDVGGFFSPVRKSHKSSQVYVIQ